MNWVRADLTKPVFGVRRVGVTPMVDRVPIVSRTVLALALEGLAGVRGSRSRGRAAPSSRPKRRRRRRADFTFGATWRRSKSSRVFRSQAGTSRGLPCTSSGRGIRFSSSRTWLSPASHENGKRVAMKRTRPPRAARTNHSQSGWE